MSQLMFVDRNSVQQIALDTLNEAGQNRYDSHARELEPEEIWKLIGGIEGIERLQRNSRVLIDLAFYIQQQYPEALATAVELRKKAGEIDWHLERLRAASKTGKLEVLFAPYAQEAIAAYYLMTKRLLELREHMEPPLLIELQRNV